MSTILTGLPPRPRNPAVASSVAARPTLAWLLVGGLWVYLVIATVWLVRGWGGGAVMRWVVTWHSVPPLLVVLGLMWPMIHGLEPGYRRIGWQLIFWAGVSDGVADLWWAYPLDNPTQIDSGWSDLPFVAYYPLAAAAFAMFYRDLGGSFRSRQVWLDIFTLALGMCATLWLFLLEPELQKHVVREASTVSMIGYFVGEAVMLVFGSLLIMQISEWRAERALLLLIAANVASFTTDLSWLTFDPARPSPMDIWSSIGSYELYYALLGTAVVLEQHYRVPARFKFLDGNRYSFLPILSVLLAIVMLYGEDMDLRRGESWALLAFVAAGAALVAVRQQGVRTDILRMQHSLVQREAQQHLTELVRRSADLIAIVDAFERLSFVSPAAQTLLGESPDALKSRPASRLLGVGHEARLQAFLLDIARRQAVRADMELVVPGAAGQLRTLLIIGSDQLANAAICGIVLTICDVSERRRLEREVLEIAVHERERLASDIRDGLGLELNGIKGLLARLRLPTDRVPDTPARSVDGVIAQVNRTIDLARKLAVNLSPLHVARGSLELVMAGLAQEIAQRFSLQVDLEQDLQQWVIPGPEADHLYRIAQEVLDHEARYGNCTRIKIDLCVDGDRLLLLIGGNGGTSSPLEAEAPLGLRMAEYRTRMIGGVLHRERTWEGTCVEVSVPLQSFNATAGPDIPRRAAEYSDRKPL